MLFFVFLLPALAHARISISIDLSSRENYVKVNFAGENVRLITDAEAEGFGLEAISHEYRIWGERSQFTLAATNLTEVLKPIKATVLSFRSKPTALVHHRYKNNGTTTVQYRADLQQSVTNTVSNSGHQTHTIQVGTEISTEVNFGVGKVAGKTSLSYNHQWGKSSSKSQSMTVGSSAGLTIPVPPGATVEATMFASQGTTEIEVVYEASIHGACSDKTVNFERAVVDARPGAVPKVRQVIEIIKVEFYSDFEAVSHITQSNHTMVGTIELLS